LLRGREYEAEIGPAVIERETKKQYRAFAAEIERRSAAVRRGRPPFARARGCVTRIRLQHRRSSPASAASILHAPAVCIGRTSPPAQRHECGTFRRVLTGVAK